jgi:hypothetical protein
MTYAIFRTLQERIVSLAKQGARGRPGRNVDGADQRKGDRAGKECEGVSGSKWRSEAQAIQIGEGKIQAHLGEVDRNTLEETLNAMLVLHHRPQPLRCLSGRSDCQRVKRTSSDAGLSQGMDQCFLTGHENSRKVPLFAEGCAGHPELGEARCYTASSIEPNA